MTAGATPIPEGKYAVTDGGLSIHYHEAGSGEPIVFLHGSGPGASGYSNFKGNYPSVRGGWLSSDRARPAGLWPVRRSPIPTMCSISSSKLYTD